MAKYNLEKFRKFLPKKLVERGVSLEKSGINEYIWTWKDAIEVVEILTEKGFFILGGDVYSKINEKYEPTFDNWYVNRPKMAITKNDLFNSKNIAEDYINSYVNRKSDNFYFSIVADL